MRAALTFLTGCMLFMSCRSAAPYAADPNDQRPLPDLVIKKITYHLPPMAPQRAILRGGIYQPQYEFKLEILNIGNVPFDQPFLVSYSTSMNDYQSSIYSKQERLNETGLSIAPGKSMIFTWISEVDIQPSTVRLSNLPMRFLLNHDWGSTSRRPIRGEERELNYDNNIYELSMRVQIRR